MPRKHRAPDLEELALRSVGTYITDFGKNLIRPIQEISQQDPDLGLKTLSKLLTAMKYRLSSSVPWHLYDKMAIAALGSIMNLINETRKSYNDFSPIGIFLSEVNVVVSLIEVVVHANLRSIEFAAWPKIMRHVLYNNLHNMTGLEVLDLGSGSAGWRTSDIEKIIINGVATMPNLISFTLCFDCTDNIIAAVGQNCPKLRYIDVTASRSVTDRSIVALSKSRVLREVKLFRTSVSIIGYANLLLAHSRLEDIGRCHEIGNVLEHIREKFDATTENYEKQLYLRSFESRNVAMNHLYLLIAMCPYVTRLSLMCDERISDLTILAALENLTELRLLSCYFYADRVKNLLELTNGRIISLHLEHVDEIDTSALVYISQYCPEIRNLTFYNCELLDHTSSHFRKLPVEPFKYLERIKFVADCASVHLEFLLSHCTNVKFIQLGSSTGIGDTTMKRVFSQNPMSKLEELKILYSDDLSMRTVRLLMQNCGNLRRISELESWQGISSEELRIFREELKTNNFDLDTSPTLSLA
ncbi:uncharacterized protein [Venturia canescens]|uniref:uncharacterized protein n=1 Tax=Venturia canescens TaxID=32260 RepID=UPI001C9C87BD|nr:uncharacterized protein LOC122408024 [Venturia canescens]